MDETNEWGHAIERYINPSPPRKPDPAPLAALLLSDKPIPKDVRSALAEIIRPTQKTFIRPNYKIVLKPTGAFDRIWKKMLRNQSIAFDVGAQIQLGKTVEDASKYVANEYAGKRVNLDIDTVKKIYNRENKGLKFWGIGFKRRKNGVRF